MILLSHREEDWKKEGERKGKGVVMLRVGLDNTMTKVNRGEERLYLTYRLILLLREGRTGTQDRILKVKIKKKKKERRRSGAYWLLMAHSACLLIQPMNTSPRVALPTVAGPFYINHQSRKWLTGLLIANLMGTFSQLRGSSFQMTLDCVKVTKS